MIFPQRDSEYLAFVRTLACAACSSRTTIHAHHSKRSWPPVSAGGISLKGSDYCAVPLCALCHHDIHARGSNWLSERRGLDLDKAIVMTLILFISSRSRQRNA